ncbi:MAG TPA: FtsX-like permease family protein, partial [Vicinamibacterales bacterium]|nr:FtsX-like permease family protein [Vicinamibacterales bacterium]
RALVGADIVIGSRDEWPEGALETLDRITRGAVLARTEAVETATMARPADPAKGAARTIELRGVKPEFPLYGKVELGGGQPYSHALLASYGALVRPELLAQLDVQVGDEIIIGGRPFTIRGTLLNEPGRRAGGFSLGPRVLIDYDALQELGLLTFGSRARRQVLLRTADHRVADLTDALRAAFKNTFVSVRSYRMTGDEIGEDLERAEGYLSLAGLTVLVLGGIGVSSVTRVFIEQKLKSIAVLKCVGAGTHRITAIYFVQVLALGLAGSLVGLLLGRLILAALPAAVGEAAAGISLRPTLTWSAVVQAVAIGVLVSVLFSIVPLLRVRRVRPLLLLRREQATGGGFDWMRAAAMVLVSVALAGVAAWQAGSLVVGVAVCVGFAVVAAGLYGAALLLVRAVRPFTRSRHFAVRHAALHLDRPGNQTRVVLLAVGLGAFFLVGIRAVESNLFHEVSIVFDDRAPDLFLIDVQPDQRAGVSAIVERHTGAAPRMLPVLRARVTQVRGRDTTLDDIEDVRGRGSLAREYTITYRGTLEANERVIEGTFWDDRPSDQPEVSIERGIQERFRIHPGDTIRFEVLGRPIVARVTSVREVNWRDSRAGGFMFVFRPGTFDGAPHAYIAPVRGPMDPRDRGRLQRDLAAAFPNVSAIDVREILTIVRDLVDRVVLATSVIGAMVLGTGVLILIGAVATTKFRRMQDAAILKTLGASSRQIGALLLLEYGLLGVIAGIIGAAGGAALSWGVSRYVFDIGWQPPLTESLAGIVLTALMVAGVGLAASVDVLRRKPLATLRAE